MLSIDNKFFRIWGISKFKSPLFIAAQYSENNIALGIIFVKMLKYASGLRNKVTFTNQYDFWKGLNIYTSTNVAAMQQLRSYAQ
jgi:hypothetical protein